MSSEYEFSPPLSEIMSIANQVPCDDKESLQKLDEIIFTIGRIKQRLARGPVAPQRPPKPQETNKNTPNIPGRPPSFSPKSPMMKKKTFDFPDPKSSGKKSDKQEKKEKKEKKAKGENPEQKDDSKKKKKEKNKKLRPVSFTNTQCQFLVGQLQFVKDFLEVNFEPTAREKIQHVNYIVAVILEMTAR